MNRKKLMATMAGVMALSVGLTACGGSSDDTTSTDDKQVENNTDNKISLQKATNPDSLPDVAKNRKDTLVIGLDLPDGIFNPLYTDSAYDIQINEVLFAQLLQYKDDGTLEEGLCERAVISDDKKTYTFKLKDDLKWSDGEPITTDDIEFTYKVMADKSYTGPQDMNTIDIAGWKDYNEGKSKDISGIKKVDKQTVEITVNTPAATSEEYLGVLPIIPLHYYGKNYVQGKADETLQPLHRKPEVTSGAYKFKSYTEGQEVDLVANENFYLGTAKIPNLIFKVVSQDTYLQLLQTGEIDMVNTTITEETMEQLADMEFVDVHYWPNNGYGYMGFNMLGEDSKFKDPKVRQALTYGLDRKTIVENIYGEYADQINIPQSALSWAFNDEGTEKYEFNTEKAAELLEEAGWTKNSSGILEKDGKPFEIRFLQTTPNEVNDALVPVAIKNYEALGIKFTPEQMDFPTLRKKLDDAKAGVASADYDMYFMAWSLNPDPDSSTSLSSKGSQNKNGYNNPKVDELLKNGLNEFDLEKRKEIYHELYKELNSDLPYIFVYQRKDGWAVNSKVEGFTMSPYRRYTMDIQNFTLK